MSIQLSGIDVSQYQGSIDWTKVVNDGIEFAIIRAGYGRLVSQEDKYFTTNYSGATAALLPIGAYWFSYALTVAEAEAEAAACLQVISGKNFVYPVFIDIEEISGSELVKEHYTNIAIAFCKKIAAAGYKAGVYANKYTLTNYIDTDQLSSYYIWLANYINVTNYTGRYDIHQYSNTGSVAGISGNVDLNRCYTDFIGSTTPTESITPTEPSTSFTAGDKVTLSQTALFVSSTAVNSSSTKSGTYYVYDGIVVNGRIRITNSLSNVGKTPAGTYVTGWINQSDI